MMELQKLKLTKCRVAVVVVVVVCCVVAGCECGRAGLPVWLDQSDAGHLPQQHRDRQVPARTGL